jgi:hypothetical protein
MALTKTLKMIMTEEEYQKLRRAHMRGDLAGSLARHGNAEVWIRTGTPRKVLGQLPGLGFPAEQALGLMLATMAPEPGLAAEDLGAFPPAALALALRRKLVVIETIGEFRNCRLTKLGKRAAALAVVQQTA